MEFTGLEKTTRKVFDDPELFEVYEQARHLVKREEKKELPKLDVLERWNRILEIRGLWKELFENWPRETPAKEVRTRLSELRAEEHRLLAEIAGERKTDAVASAMWLSQKVGSLVGYCTGCQKEREYTIELAARMMKVGMPVHCGQRIRLKQGNENQNSLADR